MSRWINSFDSHKTYLIWLDIVKLTEKLDRNESADVNVLTEFSRFQKLVSFLNAIIEGIDPELFDFQIFENVFSSFQNCHDCLVEYKKSQEFNMLQAANQHLDDTLSSFQPFYTATGKSIGAVQASFRRYSKLINSEADSYKEKKEQIELVANEVNQLKTEFLALKQEYFEGDENTLSVYQEYQQLLSDLNSMKNDIQTYCFQLLDGGEEKSTVEAVASALEEIEEIKNRANHCSESIIAETATIDEFHKKIGQLVEESDLQASAIVEMGKSIHSLSNECFEGFDGGKSLNERFKETLESFEHSNKEIDRYYRKLTEGSETELSIISDVHEKQTAIDDSRNKIDEMVKNSEGVIKTLREFYVKVFGRLNEDGVRSGGLEQELEYKVDRYDHLTQTHSERYDSLEKEINSLLPGATSAGLASAYRELKESFNDPIRQNSKIFYQAIAGLFLVSLIFTIKSIGGSSIIEFIDISKLESIGSNVLAKFPLFAPFLWLAVFASKRRSEAQRLQQEYAHKEAIAKSYEGFKKQILELGRDDTVLINELLNTAITAIAFNASETLDGKHGEKMPLHEVLENAISSGVGPFKKKVSE